VISNTEQTSILIAVVGIGGSGIVAAFVYLLNKLTALTRDQTKAIIASVSDVRSDVKDLEQKMDGIDRRVVALESHRARQAAIHRSGIASSS